MPSCRGRPASPVPPSSSGPRTSPTSIPCGPDVEPIVEAAQQWKDAGFTDLAFVQIGNDTQQDFVRWAEKELLPAVREL